ncbi:MAG TPA: nitroreductase family protein [Acidimicrobiia bacterium]|jgi:nitroreductase
MPGPASYPEAYRNVLQLRAIRDFSDRPLSDAHLHAIIEAGRWTGSSKNRQRWGIVVITDPDQRERLAKCGDYTEPVRQAPLTIALVQEDGGNEFDIGRLAQNLMLAARAVGVISCPVTLHRHAEAAKVLGLPAGAKARYGVALGYAATGAAPSHRGGRVPLDTFVHWDRY